MDKSPFPGEAYWSLVDPIWDQISIYDGAEKFLAQFEAAPLIPRHLFAAHWLQSEVCNGGLHQFFSNSTGILAPEALAAFRAMGLAEWADILAEAMEFFGKQYPRERDARDAFLVDRCIPGCFDALDDRFYAWLHAEEDRWEHAADRFAALHRA